MFRFQPGQQNVTVIIDIMEEGNLFLRFLNDVWLPVLVHVYGDKDLPALQSRLWAVYQETIRQIFDCMSYDYTEFTLNLLGLPKTDRLLDGHILEVNRTLHDRFMSEAKTLALSLYFNLHRNGVINPNVELVLEHPDRTYIVIHAYDRSFCV
jgi:hypothetical protein